MKIADYLKEIKYAIESILELIHKEHETVKELIFEVTVLTKETDSGYRTAHFLAINPDIDDDNLGTAIYYDTYFGVDKERFYKNKDLENATQKLNSHKFSIDSLSGSIFQYAKQGLSLRYAENLNNTSKEGRIIMNVALKDIIISARNQSIHWEEGEVRPKVKDIFDKLALQNQIFGEYNQRNLAYEVLKLLNWKTYDNFSSDMSSLDIN